MQGKTKPYAKLSDSCVDPSLRNTLVAAAPNDNGFSDRGIPTVWVDYILTTANTWKTPIKDFELVVERPKPERHEQYYVSFCWDGKVKKRGPDTFVATLAPNTKLSNVLKLTPSTAVLEEPWLSLMP